MPNSSGPGSPFVCLFDEDTTDGPTLMPELQAIYGRWPLLVPKDRPYTFVNFVTSRDGKISFNEPGKSSGGPISGFNRHDRWMMGLLRARADAILTGASALEHAPRQVWNAEGIFPDDTALWQALRRAEGRTPIPMHVITTRSGKILTTSPVITNPDVAALIVTTDDGYATAREAIGDAPNVRILSQGAQVDFARLGTLLGTEYGVRTLVSEAGPNVYGAMLDAGIVDDEFITFSPIVAGHSKERPRLSLIEGISFSPDAPPRSRLLSLYRSGDYLFLHSRYTEG